MAPNYNLDKLFSRRELLGLMGPLARPSSRRAAAMATRKRRKGLVAFQTVYPGWYQGRTPHIHFKVRTFDGESTTHEFTSQLYFDDAVSDEVYAQTPYNTRGDRDTRNENDGIYGQGGEQLTMPVTKSGDSYAGTYDFGLAF